VSIMPKNCKLVLDTFCEVYDLLKDYADEVFWDFSNHEIIPGATYLIGREQFTQNHESIRTLIENNIIKVVFSNPAEGSSTMLGQLHTCRVTDLAQNKKLKILAGGDMDDSYSYLQYDSFLPKLLDYNENIIESSRTDEIYSTQNKPYKFLFLNGRMRPHRKYLIERFHANSLIEECLWTALDSNSRGSRILNFMVNGNDMMYTQRPHHYLSAQYEVDRYTTIPDSSIPFAKYKRFNDEWGEIYLKAEPYIDTYFSLVTETVFDYPYTFRTEKIWKPIVMGHPWIVVSNAGFYRDMHTMGFRSYGHLIDESFDAILDNQTRIERIANVVEELCAGDLSQFISEAQEVSKYNQSLYDEYRIKIRAEFPERFFKFINE